MNDIHDDLLAWLKDAHAMENGNVQSLERMADDCRDMPDIAHRLQQHAEESRRHADMLRQCIERRGGSVSAVKETLGAVGTWLGGMTSSMSDDNVVKHALAGSAMEAFEIACYRALIQTAYAANDFQTARACENIIQDEVRMAHFNEHVLPRVVDHYLSVGSRR